MKSYVKKLQIGYKTTLFWYLLFSLLLTSCQNSMQSTTQPNNPIASTIAPGAETSSSTSRGGNPIATPNNNSNGSLQSNKVSSEVYGLTGSTEIDFSTNAHFSISSSNHTSPNDVLYEAAYAGGFGGGGDFCGQTPFGNFVISKERERVEWLQDLEITVCGWKPNERVKIQLKNNAGTILYEDINSARESSDGKNLSQLDYTIPINTPYGSYVVTFEGQQSGKVTQNFSVVKLPKPRMYRLKNYLVLYNFKPNESVRLFWYETVDAGLDNTEYQTYFAYPGYYTYSLETLAAWQEYKTNDQGNLVIDHIYDTKVLGSFIAFGDISGIVHEFDGTDDDFFKPNILSNFNTIVPIRPSNQQIRNISSLWRLTPYQDLKKPGTQAYDTVVKSDSQWLWTFAWCAKTPELLGKIIEPLTIQFFIDGTEASFPQIRTYDQLPQEGWSCRRWATLLGNWPAGSSVGLEIRYVLSESIYDGNETFPPGTYHQIINVRAND